MKLNLISAAMLISGLAIFATSANAGMTTDNHGNVGYDSYDECVTAVKNGTAKFYTPYTYQKPMRRTGEVSVKKMRLSEVMIPQSVVSSNNLLTADYEAGACDLGVGQSNGRYGVSGALVGKYVPIAADMPVNVYMDRNGNPIRLSMQQCDNHFGDKFPTPIISEAPAPAAQIAISEAREVEAVVTQVRRVIRPTQYRVQEVIVAPVDQIRRVNNANGTAIAIQGANNRSVVVGQVADENIINNTEIDQTFPVIRVPNNDGKRQLIDPNTGEYRLIN